MNIFGTILVKFFEPILNSWNVKVNGNTEFEMLLWIAAIQIDKEFASVFSVNYSFYKRIRSLAED